MSRFIDEGEVPNFRRLRAQSALYTTDAGEDPPNGYYGYVATWVRSRRGDGSGPTGSAVRFAATLMRAGLSANTVWKGVWQVISEYMDKGLAWRKAGLLDLYHYDLFRGLNGRYQVQFATFFSNCVAHYQHCYWRNVSPELFASAPLPSDHGSLRNAIKTGFGVNDGSVGRVLKDYPDSIVVLCTALS